jgi:hypothetical protein
MTKVTQPKPPKTPASQPAATQSAAPAASLDDVMALLTGLSRRVDSMQEEGGTQRTLPPPELSEEMLAAIREQQEAEAAAHAELTAPVVFEVDVLFSFDGDPETEGQEHYAPESFDLAAHCEANGVEALIDEAGEPITIAGSRFTCPRVTAIGLEKARVGKIVE